MMALYVWPSVNYFNCRVALPIASGNTPTAIGSNVPPCPTFLVLKIRRTLATQSWEVQSVNLLRFKNPSTMMS